MKYFGPRYKAMSVPGELGMLVETPTGATCFYCEKPIAAGDSGVVLPYIHGNLEKPDVGTAPYHRLCFAKSLGIEDAVRAIEGEN